MQTLILWCGFLGAWLLVAGPVFQAALELADQDLHRTELQGVWSSVQTDDRVSAWWWLIPPVGYWLHRKQSQRDREALLAAMTPDQLVGWVDFSNKATGWMLVAFGAFLISVKETFELAEHYELPTYVFWVAIVVMGALCAGNTATRMSRSHDILEKQPDAGAGDRADPG